MKNSLSQSSQTNCASFEGSKNCLNIRNEKCSRKNRDVVVNCGILLFQQNERHTGS